MGQAAQHCTVRACPCSGCAVPPLGTWSAFRTPGREGAATPVGRVERMFHPPPTAVYVAPSGQEPGGRGLGAAFHARGAVCDPATSSHSVPQPPAPDAVTAW